MGPRRPSRAGPVPPPAAPPRRLRHRGPLPVDAVVAIQPQVQHYYHGPPRQGAGLPALRRRAAAADAGGAGAAAAHGAVHAGDEGDESGAGAGGGVRDQPVVGGLLVDAAARLGTLSAWPGLGLCIIIIVSMERKFVRLCT